MSGKSLMHGHGESYSGIVPTKQPNKGGRPLAEVAEGRPLAKENTPQPNPCQTQSWESGPSGLERVREAARKDGKHPIRMCASMPNIPRSEVRTVCVRSARTGLRGGQRVTAVPTATASARYISAGHADLQTPFCARTATPGQERLSPRQAF